MKQKARRWRKGHMDVAARMHHASTLSDTIAKQNTRPGPRSSKKTKFSFLSSALRLEPYQNQEPFQKSRHHCWAVQKLPRQPRRQDPHSCSKVTRDSTLIYSNHVDGNESRLFRFRGSLLLRLEKPPTSKPCSKAHMSTFNPEIVSSSLSASDRTSKYGWRIENCLRSWACSDTILRSVNPAFSRRCPYSPQC